MLKLLKYLRGKAVLCAIIAPFLMLIEVIMDLMQPKLLSDIVDIGIVNRDISYVYVTGVKMIFAAIFGVIGGSLNSLFASIAAMNMSEKMRQGIFEKIQEMSFKEIDKFKAPSLITRLTNDIIQVQNMVVMALRITVRAPLLCIGGVAMAVLLSPKLSVVFLVAIPLILLAVVIIMKKSYPLFAVLQEKVDGINTVVRESILGIRVIKAFNVEEKQEERFAKVNSDLMDKGIQAQNMNMMLWPIVILVMNLSVIAVLWFGGNMANNHTIEIGKIMAFINYLIQIMNSFMMVIMILLNFSRAKASADRINEVLDSKVSICDSDSACKMNSFDINFENVSFKYNEHSDYVLKNITVSIKEGEKVGIIGATGSGKSTFVNLIARLYDVTEGRITVGGVNVRHLKLKDLRDKMGMVLQESILFSGTIADNLQFGSKDKDLAGMESAANDAQALEFIHEKKEKFKSYVEQRGKNLSGGQKQRISIARTLMRNPQILILDDSSSALDMTTEANLQNAIKKRMKDSTVLTIAQRISGVMDADKIVVLENGMISAIGTHQELLRDNEIYYSIASSQLGEEVILDA